MKQTLLVFAAILFVPGCRNASHSEKDLVKEVPVDSVSGNVGISITDSGPRTIYLDTVGTGDSGLVAVNIGERITIGEPRHFVMREIKPKKKKPKPISETEIKYYSVLVQARSDIATRDSLGNWKINGRCDSLLEAFYQNSLILQKQNDRYYNQLQKLKKKSK